MLTFPSSIDLQIAGRLKESQEFRQEWFQAELEVAVPALFRAMRERRKFNQTELAEKASMMQSAISRFERSTDAKWNIETLLALANALDAQLTVRLEASEDVISRVERQESQSVFENKSSAANQAGKDNFNQVRIEQPLFKQPAQLLGRAKIIEGGNRPWN